MHLESVSNNPHPSACGYAFYPTLLHLTTPHPTLPHPTRTPHRSHPKFHSTPTPGPSHLTPPTQTHSILPHPKPPNLVHPAPIQSNITPNLSHRSLPSVCPPVTSYLTLTQPHLAPPHEIKSNPIPSNNIHSSAKRCFIIGRRFVWGSGAS